MSQENSKRYAGFWVRFFAGILDTALMMPLLVLLLYFFGVTDSIKITDDFGNYSALSISSDNQFVDLALYAISIIYLAYFIAGKQQATLGKRWMGIYVGNVDGSKLSWQKSLARALASILTALTCGLGFIMLIFTKEKTALHDLICNSRVFHGSKK